MAQIRKMQQMRHVDCYRRCSSCSQKCFQCDFDMFHTVGPLAAKLRSP